MLSTNNSEPEELEIAHQTLSAVFASTPDGLVVLNDALTIVQANPTFCAWVDKPADEIVGDFIANVLSSEELILALHTPATDQRTPTEVELTVTSPSATVVSREYCALAGRALMWLGCCSARSKRTAAA